MDDKYFTNESILSELEDKLQILDKKNKNWKLFTLVENFTGTKEIESFYSYYTFDTKESRILQGALVSELKKLFRENGLTLQQLIEFLNKVLELNIGQSLEFTLTRVFSIIITFSEYKDMSEYITLRTR